MRWSDIDLKRQYLHVLHTVDYIPNYGYIEDTPKSKASKRKIALPSFMVEMLEEQKRTIERVRENGAAAWEENNLVFPRLKGGDTSIQTISCECLRRSFGVLASRICACTTCVIAR